MNVKDKPARIILGTKDIILNFESNVHGILNPVDITEVMTQVIAVLLGDDSSVIEYSEPYPDYERFIDKAFLNNEVSVLAIESAIDILSRDIYNRLKESGIYCDDTFTYFFEKFLGKDIILKSIYH